MSNQTLSLEEALSSDKLDFRLQKHGYAVLRLPRAQHAAIQACDATFLSLFAASAQDKERLRTRRPTTRALARVAALPLAGLGYNTVIGHGAESSEATVTREQLHLVADDAALALLPWPRAGALQKLESASQAAVHSLGALCSGLLSALDEALERTRSEQAERLGDPSVLDAFLYPAAPIAPMAKRARMERRDSGDEAGIVGATATASARCLMRTHTDPGLLTLTLASCPAGLEVLDGATGRWVAAEARCGTREALLLCGEALQLMTAGRYRACPHRVMQAEAPRFSLVFELRLHRAEPPRAEPRRQNAATGAAPAASAAASTEQHQGEAAAAASAELEEARRYVRDFVAARLEAGATAVSVLDEFRVPVDARPAAAEGLPLDELAALVLCWVRACCDTHAEQQEAAAAFASAEHVVCTPAFADSTGRFVDVDVVTRAPS